MQKAYVQNLKVVILAGAIAFSLMMDHKSTHHAGCADCDQPDLVNEAVAPVLIKDRDVVAQDYFQGKDT